MYARLANGSCRNLLIAHTAVIDCSSGGDRDGKTPFSLGLNAETRVFVNAKGWSGEKPH